MDKYKAAQLSSFRFSFSKVFRFLQIKIKTVYESFILFPPIPLRWNQVQPTGNIDDIKFVIKQAAYRYIYRFI